MNRRGFAHHLVWGVLCVALATACAPGKELQTASDLDRKFDNTSYIEEGELVALIAGTRVAYARKNPEYFPLEVAIVNKGLPGISLTPESFTLIDDQGKRYPVVDGKELRQGYNVDVDRRLATLPPVVRGIFGGYSEIPAALTTSFDNPIPQDLHVPRFSWAAELIYFPLPEGGIRGKVFELFMDARELEDPVFVRFTVAGKENG